MNIKYTVVTAQKGKEQLNYVSRPQIWDYAKFAFVSALATEFLRSECWSQPQKDFLKPLLR